MVRLKPLNWFKWIVFPLLSVAVIAAWLILRAAAPQSPPWLTAPVTRQNLEDTVLATGTIRAARLINVGTQATGQVKSLHVRVGDKVRAGQLIAEIDDTTQQNTLRDEMAAQQSIMAQQSARQAALEFARQTLKRQQEMYAQDATSQAELESAQNALKAADAELRSNTMQLRQAATKIETAKANLGYTRIAAPMDGTVVAVITEEGQTVNSSLSTPTIIKLAQLDTVLIEAQLSEADVPRLEAGMPAWFTLLGDPGTRYPTTLQEIDLIPSDQVRENTATPSSQGNQGGAIYYNGLLRAANTDGKLRVAMTAQVVIQVASLENTLAVPAAALGKKDASGRYEVQVVQVAETGEENIVPRLVRTGLNNRVHAQILEGLQEGEMVVIGKTKTGNDSETDPEATGGVL